MEHRLLEFVDCLRRAGVRVSPAESLVAVEGLAALDGIGDRETVRAALRALLVKNERDFAAYEELFELFFGGFEAPLLDGEPGEGGASDLLQRALDALGPESPLDGLDELQRLLDPVALESHLQQSAEDAGLDKISNRLQIGYFTRRLVEQMGLDGAGPGAEELAHALSAMGAGDLDPEEVSDALEALRQRLREHARRRVERRLRQNSVAHGREAGAPREDLAERSFFSLSAREIQEMNEVVSELARKLKTVLSLRRRRSRRGGLDAQRTIRQNLQYGGVPFDLAFRRKRIERPEIVNLCDVSGSVRYIAHFMLQFIYSIQDQFARVRSFVYVRNLFEVTDWFQEYEIREAIGKILSSDRIDYFNNSDFGHVFDTFRAEHLGDVTHRTTVLILGDARNNYHDARAEALQAVAEKAKRVIWLNPENRLTWGFGDSVMYDYAPHCDEVREVRNLNQLVQVVRDVVG